MKFDLQENLYVSSYTCWSVFNCSVESVLHSFLFWAVDLDHSCLLGLMDLCKIKDMEIKGGKKRKMLDISI